MGGWRVRDAVTGAASRAGDRREDGPRASHPRAAITRLSSDSIRAPLVPAQGAPKAVSWLFRGREAGRG